MPLSCPAFATLLRFALQRPKRARPPHHTSAAGEGPEPAAAEIAAELGLSLPPGFSARLFDPAADVAAFDLLLTLDKYTAADALREVSSFDLIRQGGGYSARIRKLGEWRPATAASKAAAAASATDGNDIDDPLYGNAGGEAQRVAVRAAAKVLAECCEGLAQWLAETQQAAEGGQDGGLAAALRARVEALQPVAWLVPPMLQRRASSGA